MSASRAFDKIAPERYRWNGERETFRSGFVLDVQMAHWSRLLPAHRFPCPAMIQVLRNLPVSPRAGPALAENQYSVRVQTTEASRRCYLAGEYLVSVNQSDLVLQELNTGETVFKWPYTCIRKFGTVEVKLSFSRMVLQVYFTCSEKKFSY